MKASIEPTKLEDKMKPDSMATLPGPGVGTKLPSMKEIEALDQAALSVELTRSRVRISGSVLKSEHGPKQAQGIGLQGCWALHCVAF